EGCLCENCKSRLEKNPLRLLDCKVEKCHALAEGAPKTIDHLCEGCRHDLDMLLKSLDAMGIEYVINPSIVRGLDYYTGAVFEFISEGIGAQSTVCGGGRYDGLVEGLGGPALPGIGFGMGITRVLLAMREEGVADIEKELPLLYVAALGELAQVKALAICERLRREGKFCECDTVGRSLKAQMKYANKIGAKYTLIIGDSEIETGRAMLRDMSTGEQREVLLDSFSL
ncbi:MAG: histidine--tRNA ligase, partial [Clostridia bacterium]|nr:histidine--tRNA ligase [Clostridia bacterium]